MVNLKEKVNRLYKGGFTYETPKLILSSEEIDFSICAGNVFYGHFTVSNDSNTVVKGILDSSSPLLTIKNEQFMAASNRIDFKFDATYLEPNNTIYEIIKIISDCGEYTLRVRAHISRPYFDSSIGKIMDLTRFTYLARYNWDEAIEIFNSNRFPYYILSNDDDYAFIRKHLLKSKSQNHALEQFLVAINQKRQIELSINDDKYSYEVESESVGDKILITMETWGYINIDISTDSPFIMIQNKNISSESFVGNSYFLEFIISPEKMHKGNNYGRIYIASIYQTLVVEVKAVKTGQDQEELERAKKFKSYRAELTTSYLSYRLDRISKEKYIARANDLLAGIKGLSSNTTGVYNNLVADYSTLFLIELLIVDKDEEQGKRLLNKLELQARGWKKSNAKLYWAYLALKAKYSTNEESKKIIHKITQYYEGEGRGNWQSFFSLLYLESRYVENKKMALNEISNYFYRGMNSPYLYYEALRIFNEKPNLLNQLSQFEIQVMNFAMKTEFVSSELARQFTYLASKLKHYNNIVFEILTILYETFEPLEVLNAICSLLIKGNKRTNKYFKWYKLGVLSNLRIAELYEFYLYSIDEEKNNTLPQSLIYYFSYSNTLNVQKRSYLYAYVIKNKDSIHDLYKTYLISIEKFAHDGLKEGRINSNFAIIYQEIFFNSDFLQIHKHLLWNVVFRHDIKCNNPNIKGILVGHKELEKTSYIPLAKGQIQIDMFTDNAEVFFIDKKDNLYYKDIDNSDEALMDLASIESSKKDQLQVDLENPTSVLYTAYRLIKEQSYDNSSMEIRKRALKLENITKDFYNNNLLSIISFYNNKSNSIMLDKYIEELDSIPRNAKNKQKFIELLIDRKFYYKAFKEIKKYGFNAINESKLYILCSYILKKVFEEDLADLEINIDVRDDSLLNLSYYCYKHDRHNKNILRYLIKHFNGNCESLYKIWEGAKDYNLETKDLEVKLLSQKLFTEGELRESYMVYVNFTKTGFNSNLAKAFINYKAYEYLVRQQDIDKRYFTSMESLVKIEKNNYCILALLKYYSSLEELDDDRIKFIHRFTLEYINNGIVFSFFKEFIKYIPMPFDFVYKTPVEFASEPSNTITISYCYLDKDTPIEEVNYINEEMKHVFAGVFSKQFLLFYNNKLNYSIVVEKPDGSIQTTEEKTIELSQDMELNDQNLYNKINLLKLALDSKDSKTFIESYDKIIKTDYIVSKAFKPL